jgi:integrase
MAKPKRWSETIGARRGARVRIYERTPGGLLNVSVWRPGEGESRRSLGHRDKGRARIEAAALLLIRHTQPEVTSVATPISLGSEGSKLEPVQQPAPAADPIASGQQLTLFQLLRRYREFAATYEDGCLKTERHLSDLDRRAGYLQQYFGRDCLAETITLERWKEYAQKRRAGAINGRRVGTRSIRGDLLLLTAAMRWAATPVGGLKPLVTCNPLAAITLPTERDPRRPMLHDKTVDKLMAAAKLVDPDRLPVLLSVVKYTGRRLSSCLALGKGDVDLELGQIRWRAEVDKKRKTWVAPLPTPLASILKDYRDRFTDDDSPYLFPHPLDPARPLDKDRADGLLQRTYEVAQISRARGGLWHPFRRRWATLRKKLPLSDVAQAGGWDDVKTLLTCYQLADPDTLRQVADYDD